MRHAKRRYHDSMYAARLKACLRWLGIILLCTAAGFYFARHGLLSMDDMVRYRYSRWLMFQYGLIEEQFLLEPAWYGTLWEIWLGIQSEIAFSWLHDAIWVRHAFTWALLPLTYILTFVWLRTAGEDRGTALLCTALLYGMIRLGGYVSQIKDFPPAVVYLLSSIAIWLVIFRSRQKQASHLRIRDILALTVIALLPFLIRPPIALHSALVLAFIGYDSMQSRELNLAQRIARIALVLGLNLIIVYAAFPTTWGKTPGELFHFYSFFSEFKHGAWQRFYGLAYFPNALPWWYIFGFLPFIFHPLALLVAIGGFGLLIMQHKLPAAATIKLPIGRWGTYRLSLLSWLILVTLLSWLAILIVRPTLYDTMRHILFLYPPIAVIAGLCYRHVRVRTKLILASGIIAVSTVAYASWARYAYMYTPLWSPVTDSAHFTGDNRAVCISKATTYVYRHYARNTKLVFPWIQLTQEQANRLRYSRRYIHETPNSLIMMSHPPSDGSDYLEIVSSRFIERFTALQQEIVEGKMEVVWYDLLPTGEIACIVVRPAFTEPKDYTFLYLSDHKTPVLRVRDARP